MRAKSVRTERCPIIDIWVADACALTDFTFIEAVIDSASDVTLIRKDLFERLQFTIDKPCIENLRQAAGAVSEVFGSTWLKVKFDCYLDREELVRVHIVENGPSSFILGTDFLCRYPSLGCHWKSQRVTFGPYDVPMKVNIYMPDTTRGVVKLLSDIELPPRAAYVTSGQLGLPYSKFYSVIFEPFDSFEEKYNVYVATSLGSPNDGIIAISILNTSNQPVKLYKGTRIGKVSLYVDPWQGLTDNFICQQTVLENPSRFEKSDLNLKGDSITSEQTDALLRLLNEYGDIFSKNDSDLGRTNLITHSIDTGDAKPIKQQPYWVPFKQHEIIKEEVDKMLEKGIIHPSYSCWASPVVLIPKKNNAGYRFCVDFRKLNTLTKRDSYPLPKIDELIDSVNEMVYFSCLDQSSGYWQIPLKEEDKEKSAFCTHSGLWEFNFLPFGVTNGPLTFQRLMDLVLSGLSPEICMVYLDDILVFGRSFEEHLNRLKMVFDRIRSAGLKLGLPKCKFAMKEISYLGYFISSKGIKPDPAKVKSV